jgi:hypothetical protein
MGLPKQGTFYFGVPRWLFRELGSKVAKWLPTFDGNRRFQRKLQVFQSIGYIVESYRLSHGNDLPPRSNDQIYENAALRR